MDKHERLPFWQLANRSIRRVFAAAPVEFGGTIVFQVLGAVSLAVVLLCGRSIASRLTDGPAVTSVREILGPVACLAGALFVAGLARVSQSEARVVIGERLVRHVQADVIDVAASVDYERFEEQDFNDLRDRAVNQGANQALQLVYDLVGLVTSVVTSLSLLVVLAATVPNILPVMVLVGAPFIVAGRASARLAFRAAYDLTADDRLRWSLFRALVGKSEAKEVRVYDLRRPLRNRWADLYESRVQRMRGVALRRLFLNGGASVASSLLVAVLLVVVVDASIDGRVSVADAAIAIVALQQLSARVRTSANTAGSLRQSALFLEDFERFRRQRRTVSEAPSISRLPAFSSLDVRSLSFRYPGTHREVLTDINVHIGHNEVVALVGTSGSGKSTLAHLIAGLYEPTAGVITWDGQDVTAIDRARYWASVAIVYQDFVRYELTAGENIALGDHRRLDDHVGVRLAAERASIGHVLDRLPKGYESMLSRTYDDGVELSGGEWQRLAIARSFFRDAPLVILDEPAAALDAVAERELYDRLRELCVDRSALLISHRFSTVRLASRIYVMRDGRIEEHGTHDELIARDGHYAAMFRLQAAGYVDVV